MRILTFAIALVWSTLFLSCTKSSTPESTVSHLYDNMIETTIIAQQILTDWKKSKENNRTPSDTGEMEKRIDEISENSSSLLYAYGKPLNSESNSKKRDQILSRVLFLYEIGAYEIVSSTVIGDSIAMVETKLTKLNSTTTTTDKLYLRSVNGEWKIEIHKCAELFQLQEQIEKLSGKSDKSQK